MLIGTRPSAISESPCAAKSGDTGGSGNPRGTGGSLHPQDIRFADQRSGLAVNAGWPEASLPASLSGDVARLDSNASVADCACGRSAWNVSTSRLMTGVRASVRVNRPRASASIADEVRLPRFDSRRAEVDGARMFV